MQISEKNKSILWFLGAITLPHAIYFLGNYIQSLVWARYSDIPNFGIWPIEILPDFLAVAVATYCFSEIRFDSILLKIYSLFVIVFVLFSTAFFSVIITSCLIWNDCP